MPETTSAQPIAGSVSVDGAQLHYVVEGQGYPTLVVGSTTYYRRTFGQPLKELLRCAFLDHRGFSPGATTGAQEHYTIDLITDDVEHVRRALGWEQVMVYGHSIHGLMALEYARRYPAHVSHVVMEGTPTSYGEEFIQSVQDVWNTAAPERKARLERNLLGIEERLQGMSGPEAMVADYVANGPKLWADPTYDASWLWDGVGINMELMNQILGPIFGGYYDVATRQPPVTAPILVVMGRHDYMVPFTVWDERRRSIGDLTFALFEQSGHTPHLEEPEHFAEELARWHRQKAARR